MSKTYGIKAINIETGEVRWFNYQWSERLQAYVFALWSNDKSTLQSTAAEYNSQDDLKPWRYYVDTIPRYMSDGKRTTIAL